MSNSNQQHQPNRSNKTPKQRYQDSINSKGQHDPNESKVPTGTIYYAAGTLAFCMLFNLLYATGFIDFVRDDFDVMFSTVGILLPVTAIFQLMIQIGGGKHS